MARRKPLLPAHIDLSDYPRMPVDVEKLLDSDTWHMATGDEAKAAMTLWAKAWHQVPAGSLPANERTLAGLSGAGANWRAVRAVAMRGFVLCNDKRYYHTVLCDVAMTVWNLRRRNIERTKPATTAHMAAAAARRGGVAKVANPSPALDGPSPPESPPFEPPSDGPEGAPQTAIVSGAKQRHGQRRGNGHDQRDDQRDDERSVGESRKERKGREQSSPHGSEAARAGARASSAPDEDDSVKIAVQIIKAFDDARAEAFGDQQRRPWPAATDSVVAQRWVEAGANLDLCRAVFVAVLQKLASGGRRRPPGSLAYLDQPIADAIEASTRPLPAGQGAAMAPDAEAEAVTAALARLDAKHGGSG